MEAFTTAKQRARHEARRRGKLNPAPGRTANESQKIRRVLRRLATHLTQWLELTDYEAQQHFISRNVITDRDDDWQQDIAGHLQHAGADTDEYARLVKFDDPSIKASNRITCITWYDNEQGGGYLIQKNIYSPLPCSDWGALPLSPAQWCIIARPMIFTRQLWQWVHAVREYTGDPTFQPAGIAGWYMNDASKPFDKDAPGVIYMGERRDGEPEHWTGTTIYRQITSGFSLRGDTE